MWDRRMIGVPNRPEKPAVYIRLPEGWTADSVAPLRDADVGDNCVTRVAVVSAFEAVRINAGFKKKAEEELRANVAAHGAGHLTQHMDEIAVQGCVEVDKLLEAIKEEGYFASWVVIEECTID